MAATSFDVARLAGVSQPTVSRALRGEPSVAAETRRRVEEAAAALGYVTSHLGRGLATRRTRRIGVVAAELTNPFYPHLVGPLQQELERAGYRSVMYVDRGDDVLTVNELADGSLDGVVLTTATLESTLPQSLTDRGVPLVLLNREVDGVVADAAVVDNVRGAALMADLLVELGHERIGGLLGPPWTSTGRDRERGFRRALAAHGRELPEELTVHGPFGFEEGSDGLKELLGRGEPPTALFCANDVLALGAFDAATRSGLRIPEDLTIVGFDDITQASWAPFELTTVRCDLPGLAAVATDLLLKRINMPAEYHHRVALPVEVVLRSSHARPRVHAPGAPPPART
ncbi:LacI family DNA-binding transcriptional regulator [Geodermatophilus sp. URMC 60]|jgi:LacI family transcriptional regulator